MHRTQESLIYLVVLTITAIPLVLLIPNSGIHILLFAIGTAVAGMYAMNAPQLTEFLLMALFSLVLSILTTLAVIEHTTAVDGIPWPSILAAVIGVGLALAGIFRNALDHIGRG